MDSGENFMNKTWIWSEKEIQVKLFVEGSSEEEEEEQKKIWSWVKRESNEQDSRRRRTRRGPDSTF